MVRSSTCCSVPASCSCGVGGVLGVQAVSGRQRLSQTLETGGCRGTSTRTAMTRYHMSRSSTGKPLQSAGAEMICAANAALLDTCRGRAAHLRSGGGAAGVCCRAVMSSSLHLHFFATAAILAGSRGWGSPLLVPPPLPPLLWVCLWRPRRPLTILLEPSSLHCDAQTIHRRSPPLMASCSALLRSPQGAGELASCLITACRTLPAAESRQWAAETSIWRTGGKLRRAWPPWSLREPRRGERSP